MPLVAIPQKIEGMNKSEKYIFNKLKQLYMSEPYVAYLYLEPKIKNLSPDFILIDPFRGVVIIEVKAWDIGFIESINQKELVSIKGDVLENPLYKARRYFNTLQGVFRFHEDLLTDKGELKMKLHSLITFTNMKKEEAQTSKIDTFFEHYPARVLYKDELSKLALDSLFNNEIEAIPLGLVDSIRVAIFPEIKIVHASSQNFKHKILDEKILGLDIEQERFAKSLPLGHYVITGIPGSGKTVALLSRAVYLAKLYPKWNILIMTYNKALKSQLIIKLESIKEELSLLDISVANIEVSNFHQKAMQLSSLSPLSYKDKSDEFWRDILPNDAIKYAKPSYDVILVDEYQDFYKNWFELILKLLIEHEEEGKSYRNLFLAGDRLQSIYNPNEINWKQDIGLDMRGRAKLLKTSYRVTKEHITLGLSILAKSYAKEVEEFYDEAKDVRLENMTSNSVELIEGSYEEIAKVFERLLKTYDYADILLLAPTWQTINNIKKQIPYDLQNKIVSSKDIALNKSIFTTYHSSKGIEAKVAIVVDFEKIKDRKLIYVAVTRASHKLLLHTQNIEKSLIQEELYEMLEKDLSSVA